MHASIIFSITALAIGTIAGPIEVTDDRVVEVSPLLSVTI